MASSLKRVQEADGREANEMQTLTFHLVHNYYSRTGNAQPLIKRPCQQLAKITDLLYVATAAEASSIDCTSICTSADDSAKRRQTRWALVRTTPRISERGSLNVYIAVRLFPIILTVV